MSDSPFDDIVVDVYNGKYTIIMSSDGRSKVLRYGEPWPAFETNSLDNLHIALAYELWETRQKLQETQLEIIKNSITK